VVVERRDSSVLYRRIAADLKRGIAADEFADGSRFPSESELAARYGASRGTIRRAFAMLRAEGVLASRQGARRVVVGSQVQDFAELRSFSAWARSTGSTPGARLVGFERRPGLADEAAALDVARGAPVWLMTRVRLLDGRAVMVERTAFPDGIGSLLTDADAESGSVTTVLESRGIMFDRAEHALSAMAATAADARLLGVRPGRPLLRAVRRTTDPSGAAVEYSDDRYLGDVVSFSVVNSVSANPLSRRTH
jgi:GntR family transcriptional regulator